MTATAVNGRDVQVGDTIEFLGQEYRITRFDPHPGHNAHGNHYPARIAVSETDSGLKWSITIFDDDIMTVYRD